MPDFVACVSIACGWQAAGWQAAARGLLAPVTHI